MIIDDLEKPSTPSLSVVPKGHWRCLFEFVNKVDAPEPGIQECGCIVLPSARFIQHKRHVSRDVADTWAERIMPHSIYDLVYVEAVFFSGEAP